MNHIDRPMIGRLIAKDLYLYRWLIAGVLVAGVVSLVVSGVSRGDSIETGVNLGMLLFITTIIAFGIFIATLNILKERQDRSHLFMLSLPVSPAQYSVAKVLSALIAFLAPWLVLTAGVVITTVVTDRPNGGLPVFVVMMTFFLVSFCVLLAIVAVTMSERWTVAGILVTNIGTTVFLANLGRFPGVAGRRQEAAATWSPVALAILGIELTVILLAIGLAFALPARRKDFV